jgi:hypothetical protein
MDDAKITAVREWPTPHSAHDLRGFHRLVGYYKKFIKDFGVIAAPLTRLLRCDAFVWDNEATTAFQALKEALTTGPILQMPDFNKLFMVDCDASGTGFDVVLHQGAGPLAYFSRPFAAHHLKLATYERELIGLVQVVRHWRPYLRGRAFLVRTDHYSLKFLLDQRLLIVPQHQWISKLFGYNFEVEYRPGRLNVAVDALSRRDYADDDAPWATSAVLAIFGLSFAFLEDVRRATAAATDAQQLLGRLRAGDLGAPWREEAGLLLHGRHIYVSDSRLVPPSPPTNSLGRA